MIRQNRVGVNQSRPSPFVYVDDLTCGIIALYLPSMMPSPTSKEPLVLRSSEPDKLEVHHEYPKEPQPPSLRAEAGDAPPSSSLQQPIKFPPIPQ
jgi:hypothetical protein